MARILVLGALVLSAGTAWADVPQISADAPASGLPAVSKDGKSYARPVRVQPKDCKGRQTFVEVGTVGTADAAGKSELILVGDDCGKTGSAVATNIDTVNQTLRDGAYRSLGTLEEKPLPAQVSTGVGTITVDTGSGNKCSVAIEGSQADRWSVVLDGHVTEVRGWYDAKNSHKDAYISVLVAVTAKDTGSAGRERWVDFWPVAAPGSDDVAPGSPAEVGVAFVKALAGRDAAGVEELISTPFWKVGLTPVSGALKKSCKHADKAKREREAAKVARCIAAGASSFYGKYDAGDAVAEVDMDEFPDELRKYKKKVAKLVRNGDKLVRYHINQDGLFVFLVLVLDVDTNYATASAVLEHIDVEQMDGGD